MNDLIKKALISKIAFQPPSPPSYKESKDVIWLECKHSKKKHNNVKDPKYEKVLIPAVYLESKHSDQVILYSHGNATDMGQMLPYLQLLNTALKINVMGYDYQGYGISKPKGRPASEKRVYESITVCAEWLMNVKGIPSEKIIVFGCSLGSGATVFLASNHGIKEKEKTYKYRGVILQSAFISGLKTKLKVDSSIPFDIFPNLERISAVECPVFLIHGKADEIVPFEHALMLNKKVKYPYPEQLHIAYAGHNNIIEVLSVERYVKKLYTFIKYLNQFHDGKKDEGQTLTNKVKSQHNLVEFKENNSRIKSMDTIPNDDLFLQLKEFKGIIHGDREVSIVVEKKDTLENIDVIITTPLTPTPMEGVNIVQEEEE